MTGEPAAPVSAARCPLTVVGGFLGAGKTTLLNRLLAEAQGRFAVLVNDFGAVNIDAGLISDHDGQTVRLTNGCVCCSLADGFLDTLMRVLAEPEPFEHIIIEASGVGDPGAIAEIALVEPGLVLRSVIVLTDAERLPQLVCDPRVGDTVARQIRTADMLVLNKCDLVDGAGLTAARAALAQLAPCIATVETVSAIVPAAVLALETRALLPGQREARRWRAEAVAHEETFARLLYRRDGMFERGALVRALDSLPPSVLRLKGTVRVSDPASVCLLQVVGRRWSLAPFSAPNAIGIELVAIFVGDAQAGPDLTRLLDEALQG